MMYIRRNTFLLYIFKVGYTKLCDVNIHFHNHIFYFYKNWPSDYIPRSLPTSVITNLGCNNTIHGHNCLFYRELIVLLSSINKIEKAIHFNGQRRSQRWNYRQIREIFLQFFWRYQTFSPTKMLQLFLHY